MSSESIPPETVSFRVARDPRWATTRRRILERDRFICQYCNDWATEVDHIIPASFGGTDHESNLVASCRYCNAKAWNRVFDSFDEKRAYLQQFAPQHRRARRRRLCICADCQEVFEYRKDGATAVLCPLCAFRDEHRFGRQVSESLRG
jgi:hypothetical protein